VIKPPPAIFINNDVCSAYCGNYGYCIGELHLVPLKRILQLHPDFGYLDKAFIGDHKMTKEREGWCWSLCGHPVTIAAGTETEEEEEEARPVQVCWSYDAL